MPHTLTPLRPRRIARWMLWVWLFALSASGVNACVVRPVAVAPAMHGHGHAAPAHGPGLHDVAGPTRAHDAAAGSAALAVCAGFCDDGQQAVVKAPVAKLDDPRDHVLPSVHAPYRHAARLSLRVPPRWRAGAAPPRPETPRVIAFGRLVR